MRPLPSFSQITVIELAREGGFAFIPKLAGLRRIVVADISPDECQRLEQLLNQSLPYAREEGQPDSPAAATSVIFAYRLITTARTAAAKSCC